MKCGVKGCRKQAWYVSVDASMEGRRGKGERIIRPEMDCYPLCEEHDGRMHGAYDRMDARPSEALAKRLVIRRG